ncbi:putative thiazole-containing bacteriocin maturation protein [Paenibacillus cisolokensis]|uniref:putative thiazole-containing bacteriocin maturation protein n=1 Tax=Paenibacillus cisolokensis TaxID=1658519 RepID=UPI003D27DCA2
MEPEARLKVKGDTFFLPLSDGGVYFRNNTGSFRLDGDMIDRWVEKLLPVLNGQFTMEELTDGLPEPHRKRIYEIAEVLCNNGFARDISRDRPHALSEAVMRKYASQIEFLDSFGGSGAYRFQKFRQAGVLAAGAGTLLQSLAAALLEAGLPRFQLLATDGAAAHVGRIAELEARARSSDEEAVAVKLATAGAAEPDWRELIRPFDFVIYAAGGEDIERLRAVHAACKETGKTLLPALYSRRSAMAGPLVRPGTDGCFESAWRRVHRSAWNAGTGRETASSAAEAVLANVLAFELLKSAAEADIPEPVDRVYLLNAETLEGGWHSFLPHPLASGPLPAIEWTEPPELRPESGAGAREADALMTFFSGLTSPKTGIFHRWEEGDLPQLPLALCRVQAADPLAEGPAALLAEAIRSGLTHEEARREAGLAGIEAYVSRLAEPFVRARPEHAAQAGQRPGTVGVGAGETAAEAVCRGLRACLAERLRGRLADGQAAVRPVEPGKLEDGRCRFYWRALTTMQGTPVIGLGEEEAGFPVVWIGAHRGWYAGVGLNRTLALRSALQQALLEAQLGEDAGISPALNADAVRLTEAAPQQIDIAPFDEAEYGQLLPEVRRTLERNRIQWHAADLAVEPFLKESLGGVYGVWLREEGER